MSVKSKIMYVYAIDKACMPENGFKCIANIWLYYICKTLINPLFIERYYEELGGYDVN